MNQPIRAVLTTGTSSALVLLLGALRAKFVALEIGATGVGLLGILLASVMVASQALGLGLGGSGTRGIAAAGASGSGELGSVRAAVERGSWLLGLIGLVSATVAWLVFGQMVVPEVPSSQLAPWVGVAVGATIVGAGNAAILNGMGRLGLLAMSNGIGSFVGTAVTIPVIFASATWGLVAAFAAAPLATMVTSAMLVRLHLPRPARLAWRQWSVELRPLLALGVAISASLILGGVTQLLTRVWVKHQLGLSDAGYFQAAWSIAAVYLGFLLTALAADYYPRISGLHRDTQQMNEAADEQIRMVIYFGLPVIIWMIVLAPWLLELLYSDEFRSADTLLRLLLLGDLFKLPGWAVGFLLLAREARWGFFGLELLWNACFLLITLTLVHLGLDVLGLAYLIAYFLYVAAALLTSWRRTRMRLSPPTLRVLALAAGAGGAAFVSAEVGSSAGTWLAAAIAGLVSFWALERLLVSSRGLR